MAATRPTQTTGRYEEKCPIRYPRSSARSTSNIACADARRAAADGENGTPRTTSSGARAVACGSATSERTRSTASAPPAKGVNNGSGGDANWRGPGTKPGGPSSTEYERLSDMTESRAMAQADGRITAGGAGSLAREMARAYERMVDYYRRELSPAEADARALGGGDLDRLEATPADQLSWFDLGGATRLDPERAGAIWERAVAAARDELTSGHRAARAVESDGGPWQRAQFAALLEEFVADWQPRGGIERALVETLAQAYTNQLYWTGRMTILSGTEARRQDRETTRRGEWSPPTIEAAAAIDQAAAMVDRFNRLFVRTLKVLRDGRRNAPAVVVQNGGQLNLAQAQLNIGQAEVSADDPQVEVAHEIPAASCGTLPVARTAPSRSRRQP
jgi:hypothetical protein